MTIEYDIAPEDIIAYNLYCSRNLPEARRSYTMVTMFCVLVAIVTLLALVSSSSLAAQLLFLIVLVVALSFSVSGLFLLNRGITKQTKKDVQSGKYKYTLGKQTVVITPDSCAYKSSFCDGRYFWQAVKTIAVTDSYIYIFVCSTGAIIVPRRAFSDEARWNGFGQLAKEYHDVVLSRTVISNLGEVKSA